MSFLGNTPALQTDRLILRRFRREDAPALYAMLGDARVGKFLPMFPLQSVQEAERYLQTRYFGPLSGPRRVSIRHLSAHR